MCWWNGTMGRWLGSVSVVRSLRQKGMHNGDLH
jgi:hypothetical protein